MSTNTSHDFMARIYWAVAGGAIAVATGVNVAEKLLCRQRISAARNGTIDPARPKSLLAKWMATTTAIWREVVYYETSIGKLHPPPLGRILLVLANLAILVGIQYHGFDTEATYEWERISVRAAHLSLSQIPLVFLLAGKTNIIAFLTGSSYERLNWIHRWTARTLFVTATIHFLTFIRVWDRYPNGVKKKFETDINSRTGLGTWCVLFWIVMSSFAPLRKLGYEFFVIQHLLSMVGFITMVFLHIPVADRVYVWIPVALYLADRTIRFGFTAVNNLAIFKRGGTTSALTSNKSLFACQATFTPLPSRATKVTIPNPPFKWSPGQHVLFSCHSLVPLQSHPFTITSLPSDNKLEFLIQAQGGATDKMHCHCAETLPPSSSTTKPAILDGPYGRLRPLIQFDTVVFFAGSSGAGFTVPLLRDLLQQAAADVIVTKRVKFVWAVKSRGQMSWSEEVIGECLREARVDGKVNIEASIYVTCDEKFTQEMQSPNKEKEKGVVSEVRVDEKKDLTRTSIEKISAVSSNSTATAQSHPQTSACCCRVPVDSESTSSITSIPVCCCGTACGAAPTAETKNEEEPSPISFFTGRPRPRVLLRKELEKARGETAVVVCGPRGLVEDVRRDTVFLSDERAVHKGTGAQGIWLHTESFCW